MLSLATDTGRRSASHRFASALNRFSLSGLRRGLVAVLLGLLLLAGLATEATAQTAPVANDDGTYTVPGDWALKPSAVNAGGRFRLLFTTSDLTTGAATDIGHYNGFVQARATSFGHSAIRPYGSLFRALGSTAAVNARTNTMTTGAGTGIPIYWLGGARVADNYADLYDGSWDNLNSRNQLGTINQGRSVLTGTNNDGTTHSSPLGGGSPINGIRQARVGRVATSGSVSPLSHTNQIQTKHRQPLRPLPSLRGGRNVAVVSLTLDTATALEGDSGFTDYVVTISLSKAVSDIFRVHLCVNRNDAATATYSSRSSDAGRDWSMRAGLESVADLNLNRLGNNNEFCSAAQLGGEAGLTETRVIRVFGDTTTEEAESIILDLQRRTSGSSPTPGDISISPPPTASPTPS